MAAVGVHWKWAIKKGSLEEEEETLRADGAKEQPPAAIFKSKLSLFFCTSDFASTESSWKNLRQVFAYVYHVLV